MAGIPGAGGGGGHPESLEHLSARFHRDSIPEREPKRDSIPEREPKPGFRSAYEESLKRYADKWSDIVICPLIGMSFDSLAEAYEFYNLYSWEVGFGIRWNDSTKNADKSVMVQEIVCNCEGKPEMSDTAVRTDCKARIQLHKFNDNGWYILQFQGDHNHPLSGTCSENSIWPSHKHLEPYTKDMIYDSRHKWAKPYFKEKLCAKQTSMQRNECADHIFKGYVPLNRSINMFVRYYNKILSDLDSKESFEEKRSRKRSRVMSKGVPVEEHAAKIYTRAMFEKFDEIIFQSGSYVVDEKERGKTYLARHIRSDCRESWSQVEFEVTIRAEDGVVVCECGLGEHTGMPCCHAVKVMIHLGMLEIPAGNIVKRWTMDARDVLPPYSIQHESDKAAEDSQSYRRSELFISALEFVKAASRSDQTFEVGFPYLVQMKQELWEYEQVKDVSVLSEKFNRSAAQGSDVQGMSAAAKDDATSAAQKRETEADAPDLKPENVQSVQHTQANGP
ncbi:unnamed protein product [Urochloa decumbens]|uniref:SWIM-type domain-containing protein n=1 Tax=Urochloa decumbens TaxID=240449 RepID=A0ABC9GBW4_9POAL